MTLSRRAANAIWGRSGGRCYLDPSEELTRTPSGSVPIGEVAHIVARSPAGPRSVEATPAEELDSPENLILVCPTHHAEIDAHPDVWTVERLRNLKRHHEEWVLDQLSDYIGWDPDAPRQDKRSQVAVGLETATVDDDGVPRFGFALRNAGPDTVVVHTLLAEILAVEVRPSTVQREHRLAYSMLIMRTPVSFDLDAAEGTVSRVATGRFSRADGFEVAIELAVGERHLFSGAIQSGDFQAGIFRIVARYWDWPEPPYFAAASDNVGMFHLPDDRTRMDFPVLLPEPVGHARDEQAGDPVPSAEVLDFIGLVGLADPTSQDGTADAQALAQHALGRLNHSTARAVVEKWLDDPERVLAAIASIAASTHDAWRAAMIERALSLENVASRQAAVGLLDTLRLDDAADEALWLKALSDPAEEVRVAAADRFGSYSDNPRIRSRVDEVRRSAETR